MSTEEIERIDRVEHDEHELYKDLLRLERHFRHRKRLHLVITIGFPDGSTVTGVDMAITVAPDSANKYPLTATLVDTFGVPVSPGETGTVTWTAPDPSIATLDSLTGITVNLLTVGEGVSVLPITATDGTFTVSATLTVGGAGAGTASALTIVVGAPIPR